MNNLKMEIFCQLEEERKAKAYSEQVTRKAKREKAKAKAKVKLALSIIGGAAMSVPFLYGMLFLVTLV